MRTPIPFSIPRSELMQAWQQPHVFTEVYEPMHTLLLMLSNGGRTLSCLTCHPHQAQQQ